MTSYDSANNRQLEGFCRLGDIGDPPCFECSGSCSTQVPGRLCSSDRESSSLRCWCGQACGPRGGAPHVSAAACLSDRRSDCTVRPLLGGAREAM